MRDSKSKRGPMWPSNPPTGHILWESHNYKTHTYPNFTAALFAISRAGKQPRCPSAEKWIKKTWYIYIYMYMYICTHTHTHNGILLSHKKNKFESLLVRWMNLELVIQSEVSQKEENTYGISTYIWNLEKWYWWTYLQRRNGDADAENGFVDTVREAGGEEWRNYRVQSGGLVRSLV